MAFISLPIYIPQKTSSKLGLNIAEASLYEKKTCMNILSYVCTDVGQKYACRAEVREAQYESVFNPPIVPSVIQYYENVKPSSNIPLSTSEEDDQVDNSSGKERFAFSIHIHGELENVLALRSIFVRIQPTNVRTIIRTCSNLVLLSNGGLHPFVKSVFTDVEKQTSAYAVSYGNIRPSVPIFETEPCDHFGIEITGHRDAVIHARIRVLCLLLNLSGYYVDTIEMENRYIPSLAGLKHAFLREVMAATETVIYTSFSILPHHGLPMRDIEHLLAPYTYPANGVIFICGKKQEAVHAAKELLLEKREKLEKSLKNIKLNLGWICKRDWLLNTQLDNLVEIMYKTGTFLEFSVLGSSNTDITLYGANPVYLMKASRILSRLACKICVAVIEFSDKGSPSQGNPLASTLEGDEGFLSRLSTIASIHGTEIHFAQNTLTVFGTYKPLHFTCYEISCLPEVQFFRTRVRFETELDAEQKEFFLGKKQGKVKIIMQATMSTISVEQQKGPRWNSRNVLILLTSDVFLNALRAFELIHRELPAEVSFYIPEDFHKRLIGGRGLTIQGMTSIHKVFVRFSNKVEHSALGGYEENEDNVIARTPAKFKQFLISFKKDIYKAVINMPARNTKERGTAGPSHVPEYRWYSVSVPIQYHPFLLQLIPVIKVQCAIQLEVLPMEYGSDEVLIFGVKGCLETFLLFLRENLTGDFQIYSHNLIWMGNLCLSAAFNFSLLSF